MRNFLAGVVALLLLIQLTPGQCETRQGYVSDMLILTFREGPGPQYKVLKSLTSNTPIKVISKGEKYLEVELASGQRGWVDKNFVIFTPPNALKLKALEKKNQGLADQLQKQTALVAELRSKTAGGPTTKDNAAIDRELKTLRRSNMDLSARLKTTQSRYEELVARSGNLQNLMEENKALKKANQSLTLEKESLASQGADQFKTAMIKWALAGVGVLLMGWVMGRSVSGKRRRSSLL